MREEVSERNDYIMHCKCMKAGESMDTRVMSTTVGVGGV